MICACLAFASLAALQTEVPAKDRTVVLISLDGFPAFALEDPRLSAPTLRRLAREGASAARMTVVNPSVTWPNHTTMVTGVSPARHGVLFNGMLFRHGPKSPPKVEPWRDKTEMVRATTVYDLAHKAGLTTAQVDWVAIQNAPTITWEFAEIPKVQGKIEQELIASGRITAADVEQFRSGGITWRDEIWTEAAMHILRKHRPNLMLFHVLNLDSTHHRYGPRNLASNTGMAYADSKVGEVMNALRESGMQERATVIVVSDHGFRAYKRVIQGNAVLKHAGIEGAWVISEGGTAMVYVLDPANRAALVPKLKDVFAKVEGVDRVFDSSDFPGMGLPDPAKYDQMADLVLAAKPDYSFSGAASGNPVIDVPPGTTPGAHGYVATDPEMDAIFIAWGYGIRQGARVERVRSVDIAPTIARLLGVDLGKVEGQPIGAILK